MFSKGRNVNTPSTQPSEEEEQTQTESIDNSELKDYIDNQGQWNSALVSESKPDMDQILNGGADSAPAGKGGKGAPKGTPADATNFEEGELVIPDAPENNFLVGDAVE